MQFDTMALFRGEYEIETNGLHILNINDGSFTLLHWMGLLLNNRAFVLATPLEREAKRYITDCFPVPFEYSCVKKP